VVVESQARPHAPVVLRVRCLNRDCRAFGRARTRWAVAGRHEGQLVRVAVCSRWRVRLASDHGDAIHDDARGLAARTDEDLPSRVEPTLRVSA
jgi:hypothetical protein